MARTIGGVMPSRLTPNTLIINETNADEAYNRGYITSAELALILGTGEEQRMVVFDRERVMEAVILERVEAMAMAYKDMCKKSDPFALVIYSEPEKEEARLRYEAAVFAVLETHLGEALYRL